MPTLPIVKKSPPRQRGAALVISLVIMVIMTLIGLSGMRTTTMSEQMAGNYRDQALALQAAEAALRVGENYLRETTDLPSFIDGNTKGLMIVRAANATQVWEESHSWWSENTIPFKPHENGTTYAGVASPPAYAIEQLPPAPLPGSDLALGAESWRNVYRINSRATGGSDSARTLIVGTYWR
jgi:type IV pilus assembly protein PilX